MVEVGSAKIVGGTNDRTALIRNRSAMIWDFAGLVARLVEIVAMCLISVFTACWCEDVGSRPVIAFTLVSALLGAAFFLDNVSEGIDTRRRLLVWTAIVSTTLLAWSYVPARNPNLTESKVPVVAFRGKTNIGHRLWVVPFSKDTVMLTDFKASTDVTLANGHVVRVNGRFAI